ncbi:MAG: CotH kinase family protein [Kiritimatiellia bacterium]
MKSLSVPACMRFAACACVALAWTASADAEDVAEEVSASFDWTPGSDPTGTWFTTWGGETSGPKHKVVMPDGAVGDTHVIMYEGTEESQKWIPYKSEAAVKTDFTFLTYGCADRMTVETGQLGVIWCMGARGETKTALVKDDAGNICLVQVEGLTTTVSRKISAGSVRGYHLFTVRFSTETGASLQIDDGEVHADAAFTTSSAKGIQIGSVLSGISGLSLTRGVGFIPLKMLCYDTSALPAAQYAGLVADYPAVTAQEALEIPASSGEIISPDWTITSGNLTVGANSVLTGNVTPGEGAELAKYGAGTLTIDGTWKSSPRLYAGKVRIEASAVMSGQILAAADETIRQILSVTDDEWTVYSLGLPYLRISEIMPKSSDAAASKDPNGLESGWVELENLTDDPIDLADYQFFRVNRSKKTEDKYGNFPSVTIPAHSRYVFYTSERYSNSADMSVSAWATPAAEGVHPKLYGDDLHNVLVWPDKINPKKFPFVRLVHTPTGTIVDTVVIPSDIPDGYSIIVDPVEDGKATTRWMTATPTRGTANTATGLVALGPNAGPLYERKDQKKHDSASEFARVAAPAQPGEDYPITFSLNPTMHPTSVAAVRDEDKFTSIKLVYRRDLDDSTQKEIEVDLATLKTDSKDWGDTYTTAIPADDLPAAGHLVQWKFVATDASGNVWTTPSFNNPDDGYEWYGTIVEPSADQTSATLQTWHLFADSASLAQMDVDADSQDLDVVPHNARVAIYDSSTSNYYDYVRIDLRGHTSAKFTKKSHGLRFAKTHPLSIRDVVSGEMIEEVRKSSLIGEPADPSYMRQMVAFWLWNKMGNRVPFDFPVRCNLNGEFFQLAFHSERFSDELIEDFYKLDKYGYSYKNVGTLKSASGTTAGGIEKKTPDDGNESDTTVLQEELRAKITAAQNVSSDTTGADTNGLDDADLTKFVVEKFDLPAWLNYLASARITQEMDDVWANISIYYDNPEMTEGVRGTGTWMPLGYDMNLCFGQYYRDGGLGQLGAMATNDWFKSHPFYGGNRVRCYTSATYGTVVNTGNDGVEAVWQNAKFRRLYLRRLRTLMDQELKAPGTSETEVPFMVKMRELAELMRADSELDAVKWPHASSNTGVIDVWGTAWPATMDKGIDDIWNNYVVPRRTHLYVTHAATNTAWEIGYATQRNAGIPEAQSPVSELKPGFSAAYDATSQAVIIYNTNTEAVDLSGWTLRGPVTMTLPAGTVVDAIQGGTAGEVYVTADRRVTVAALTVADQVVVGNGTAGAADDPVTLTASDGTPVVLAPVTPAASVVVEAENEAAALEAATLVVEVPSAAADLAEADYRAYFRLVATPLASSPGSFTVSAVLDPDVVPVPQIGTVAEDIAPLTVVTDASGQTKLAVGVVNAKQGLWYGITAADSLLDPFVAEPSTFKLVEEASGQLKLETMSRTTNRRFFKVEVQPLQPAQTN